MPDPTRSAEEFPPLHGEVDPSLPQGVFGNLRATVEPTRWGWSGHVTDGIMEGPWLWSFGERRLLRKVRREVARRAAEGERRRARRDVDLRETEADAGTWTWVFAASALLALVIATVRWLT
jgi:hypothetical protein